MIKLVCMDVDGTLTDGRIYMGPSGEAIKVFDVKDGYGIKNMLIACGIIPAIITGRCSEITRLRASELGIGEIFENVEDKIKIMKLLSDKYGCVPSEIAFIGDDINDIPCMSQCGFSGCPEDAHESVKATCDFISTKKGGRGAVREFIEEIMKMTSN